MGKSLNNVVTPDEMCERFGADTFRMYEMGMGPMDMSRPWQTRDVVGSLAVPAAAVAAGRLRKPPGAQSFPTPSRTTRRCGCCTARSTGCRADYAAMGYNTAIAKLIVLTNHLTKSAAPGAAVGRARRWC